MKEYTKEEFDSLPVVDGYKQCPTGDYTAIRDFGPSCSFGSSCEFGYRSKFGKTCIFGHGCKFGNYCEFGSHCNFSGCNFSHYCNFGNYCKFGSISTFGTFCEFGEACVFGTSCRFGETCVFGFSCKFYEGGSFGSHCNFSHYCSFVDCKFAPYAKFGTGCSFEGKKAKAGYPFLAISGAGSADRTTYVFNTEEGIYVRSGCFYGNLDEFRKKVLKDCDADSEKGIQYLGFADLAEKAFAARG